MCKLCDDDVVTLAPEQTTTVRIADDQPQPLSVLSEELTAMKADLERHLDTERDDFRRYQLIDAMHSLMWARENVVCLLDGSRSWTPPPRHGELSARYPHPDQQKA